MPAFPISSSRGNPPTPRARAAREGQVFPPSSCRERSSSAGPPRVVFHELVLRLEPRVGFEHALGGVSVLPREAALALLANQRHDVPGRDRAGIGQVIDAARQPALHRGPGRGGEIIEMGQRVPHVQQPFIAHQLAQVIARSVAMTERNAQAPDIDIVAALRQKFLRQRLGAAVETALARVKREKLGASSSRKPMAWPEASTPLSPW